MRRAVILDVEDAIDRPGVLQALHEANSELESKKDLPAEACKSLIFLLISGADARNRTGDLHITNVLLYQLSYIGDDAYSSKD